MSDFDKEAEREKLREQFAENEQKRETTERMSQLLLQGATMTNSHCDTCGDPLFRYEGQTFCSTCQTTTESGEPTETAPEPTADEHNTTASGMDEQASPDEPSDERTATNDQRRIIDEQHGGSVETDRTRRSQENRPTLEQTRPTARARRTPPSQSGADSGGPNGEHAGDLVAAEQSLAETVARQANAAETAGDLGRTREHLAAAREAAEALAAVRQASR